MKYHFEDTKIKKPSSCLLSPYLVCVYVLGLVQCVSQTLILSRLTAAAQNLSTSQCYIATLLTIQVHQYKTLAHTQPLYPFKFFDD